VQSPVLFSREEYNNWAEKHEVWGADEPTHYPAIVVIDKDDTLVGIVYMSEFQQARYIVNDNKRESDGTYNLKDEC
jgi:hypothetical protein